MMHKIEANDPLARGADGYAENVRKLKELFPELVTEGPEGLAVNVDVLKGLVGDKTVTDVQEKFGLNWHGKRLARQLTLTPSLGTLRPCRDESVDWDTTQNLMIEGDNLEVLKLLKKSYAGKVKLIYIDPPYNTGKDFVYPDDFRDGIENYKRVTQQTQTSNPETSGRFHTDWLNMMYPRLKLARELLAVDGVLFVSCDERETHNLRHLLDGVFGAENFVNAICVKTKESSGASGGGEDKKLKKNVEMLAFYAKDLSVLVRNDVMRRELLSDLIAEKAAEGKSYEYRSVLVNEGARLLVKTVHDGGGDEIAVFRHSGYQIKTIAQMAADSDISSDAAYARFHFSVFRTTNAQTSIRTRVQEAMPEDEGLLSIEYLPKSEKDKGILTKKYFAGAQKDLLVWLRDTSSLEDGQVVKLEKSGTLWDDLKWTGMAKEGGVEFSNGKKPMAFVLRMLGMCTDPDEPSIILDFFAGSGTTAHAVMAQNAADGGNRRYILVQLPERLDPAKSEQKTAADFCDTLGKPRTIAELTKERLRRAAAKIRTENPLFAGDLGFRVFKLDSTNIAAWDPKPADLTGAIEQSLDHLKTDRSDDDVLYEILLKHGLDLALPIAERSIAGKAVYSVGAGTLLACLDRRITQADAEPLALGMIAWLQEMWPDVKDLQRERLCVFRDAAFAGDDVAKTNLAAILEQNGLADVRSL